MTKPDQLPPIDEALLKKLDELFPERCPDPEWTSRKVWMRVGERAVVRFLHRVFKEQNEKT